MKIRLEVCRERYEAVKTELEARGIEIDDDAGLVLSERDTFADTILVRETGSNTRVVLPVGEIISIETRGRGVEVYTLERAYQTGERPWYQLRVEGSSTSVERSVLVHRTGGEMALVSLNTQGVAKSSATMGRRGRWTRRGPLCWCWRTVGLRHTPPTGRRSTWPPAGGMRTGPCPEPLSYRNRARAHPREARPAPRAMNTGPGTRDSLRPKPVLRRR